MKFIKFIFKTIIRLIFLIFLIFLILNAGRFLQRGNLKFLHIGKENHKVLKDLKEPLEKYLKENYKAYYDIKNIKIKRIKEEDGGISFTGNFKMTLNKKPEDLPFFKALEDSKIKDPQFLKYKKYLLSLANKNYNKNQETSINFFLPYGKNKVEDLKLMKNKDYLPITNLKIDDDILYKRGQRAVKSFAYFKKPVFNLDKSVKYCRENWNREPQYQNDCANFVSQCLVAGGLKENEDFKPQHINYISTGYGREKTGLVKYLEKNNIHGLIKNRSLAVEGSVVYWNNFSHVGLITYNDTILIKYSAHTLAKLNEIIPEKLDVKFYSPIIKSN